MNICSCMCLSCDVQSGSNAAAAINHLQLFLVFHSSHEFCYSILKKLRRWLFERPHTCLITRFTNQGITETWAFDMVQWFEQFIHVFKTWKLCVHVYGYILFQSHNILRDQNLECNNLIMTNKSNSRMNKGRKKQSCTRQWNDLILGYSSLKQPL